MYSKLETLLACLFLPRPRGLIQSPEAFCWDFLHEIYISAVSDPSTYDVGLAIYLSSWSSLGVKGGGSS